MPKQKHCKICGCVVYLDASDIKQRGGCYCDDCSQRMDDEAEEMKYIAADFIANELPYYECAYKRSQDELPPNERDTCFGQCCDCSAQKECAEDYR